MNFNEIAQNMEQIQIDIFQEKHLKEEQNKTFNDAIINQKNCIQDYNALLVNKIEKKIEFVRDMLKEKFTMVNDDENLQDLKNQQLENLRKKCQKLNQENSIMKFENEQSKIDKEQKQKLILDIQNQYLEELKKLQENFHNFMKFTDQIDNENQIESLEQKIEIQNQQILEMNDKIKQQNDHINFIKQENDTLIIQLDKINQEIKEKDERNKTVAKKKKKNKKITKEQQNYQNQKNSKFDTFELF